MFKGKREAVFIEYITRIFIIPKLLRNISLNMSIVTKKKKHQTRLLIQKNILFIFDDRFENLTVTKG